MTMKLPSPVKARTDDPVKRPREWDRVLLAAYMRVQGHSQYHAAMYASVGVRSLARWETCSWWESAVEEARKRWLRSVRCRARRTVLKAVGEDATMAWKVIERTEPELAPSAKRREHAGPGGQPIPVDAQVVFYLPENGRD